MEKGSRNVLRSVDQLKGIFEDSITHLINGPFLG